MSETAPQPKPRRDYQVGERLPIPKYKIVVRPARFQGEAGKSIRGAFVNGRNAKS